MYRKRAPRLSLDLLRGFRMPSRSTLERVRRDAGFASLLQKIDTQLTAQRKNVGG